MRPISAEGLPRDRSKLLVAGTSVEDRSVCELPSILRPGDLLVLNNVRVSPRRFFAQNCHHDREIELLLLAEQNASDGDTKRSVWQALAKPLRKLSVGDRLRLSAHLAATVLCKHKDTLDLAIENLDPERELHEVIDAEAVIPIPPYIRKGRADEEDRVTYQTVFAEIPGAIAAPTAGLHFTPALLATLGERGIECVPLTLFVGRGSFEQLDLERPQKWRVEAERFMVSATSWEKITEVKRRGGRIVAVGTTTVRALESFALRGAVGVGHVQETALFIKPGFKFLVTDLLLTNFHQPQSTHLLLVSAFVGSNVARNLYDHALRSNYRFLSYGDAMLLERSR